MVPFCFIFLTRHLNFVHFFFFFLFQKISFDLKKKIIIDLQIHKVIGGSVADRDGRIQKGDRVLSINGKGLKGVTHREALAILKVKKLNAILKVK